MAVRSKTIEFPFAQNSATLASATRFDFTAITLYIPETTSRTFQSVTVQVTAMDNSTTAVSLTAHLIGIKLGAVAFDDSTVTATLTNSSEDNSWLFQRDVTSYFTTNFGSGATQTCQVGVSFTGMTTSNHTAKLIITYEAEEQQTRVKTVRIPLESGTGALTTTLTEIGTNQVPNLSTFLPESTKTFRHVWFEVEGNDFLTGTTDSSLSLALDSESASNDSLHEAALASSRWFRRIWVRNDMTTNATHAFKLAVTVVSSGMACNHLAVLLCVTYEYDHTNSTSILNSIAMPLNVVPSSTSGTSSGDADCERLKFFIEEPTTITLVQSGVLVYWVNDAASDLSIFIGSQTARTYTDTSLAYCGGISCSHRFDSGAGGGAGISLARGENIFKISVYSSATNVRHNMVNVVIYLNYTSGKATNGDGTHNHTLIFNIHNRNTNFYLVQLQTYQPQIPETSYWTTHVGWRSWSNKIGTGIDDVACANLAAERTTGEGVESGFETLGFPAFGYTDLEAGVVINGETCSNSWDRHPLDPDASRLALETSRSFKFACFKSMIQTQLYVTYHVITYTISGTVSGYTGDGSGLTVDIKRTDTDEILYRATTSAGGTFSITGYDNVLTMAAGCYQDATHTGRSADGTAS